MFKPSIVQETGTGVQDVLTAALDDKLITFRELNLRAYASLSSRAPPQGSTTPGSGCQHAVRLYCVIRTGHLE